MEMSTTDPPAKRSYRMVARAESTATTRASIAAGWLELLRKLDYDEITLDMVAGQAGVTVQTVIRHFRSKEELFSGVAREVTASEGARREQVSIGDVDSAVSTVVGHYERIGDLVLRLLSQEDRFSAVREVTDGGRRLHYRWVEQVFAPYLVGVTGAERRRRRAQIIVLTDVFTWKLLRRDLGLGERQTVAAVAEMVRALLEGEI